jgi:hypothetical protein
MPAEVLFALLALAGAVSGTAGYLIGSRHERRVFQDARKAAPPAEVTADGFEDPAPHDDHRLN